MERNNTALELPSHVLSWNSMSPQDQDTVTSVFVHMGKALAAFQRTFRSTNAPFDIFVDGLRENNSTKKAALTTAAQRGLKLFLGKARCHICHDGPLFTDLEFHDTGVRPISDALPPDLGRRSGISALLDNPFNGTGQWSDEPNGNARYKVDFLSDTPSTTGQFKTPSLRNVSKTEPYMHQGQLTTLKDVVAFYATLEEADISGIEETILQPLTLDEQQQSDLVTFLESLEDSEPSAALLALPPAQ
jgi:cytochrome c peroxidase